MKKIIIILIFILPTNLFAFEKVTNFTFEKFNKANSEGKTIIINSWNEWCTVCAAQTSIFAEAKKDFPDFEFLFYEQDKNKEIAEALNIKFWTTIVIYKDGKEIAKEIGLDNKEDIYNLLKKGI
jgi:thioredoxin 1